MPQLQINQGPQDALLYDNSRSYFTNVGYVRTSNFQMELRDVDSQNTAKLGSTVQFVIPKAADLLGPVDLMLTTSMATGGGGANVKASWVKKFGFACIDQITFSVGSHDIEKITGDQLDIINELMRDDESRYGEIIGNIPGGFGVDGLSIIPGTFTTVGSGVDAVTTYHVSDGQSFIVPLGLFFTKHPSQYFPLAAIAGCNDVRITIRFRPRNDLIVSHGDAPVTAAAVTGADIERAQLRCHYIHVTGPEASTLMNKEHVRLLKLFHHDSKPVPKSETAQKFQMDLSFLHPVCELIIVMRKDEEYKGTDPVNRKFYNYQPQMQRFSLTLNGQDRHPSLSTGIDKKYIQERLMPMLHTNTSNNHQYPVSGSFSVPAGSFTVDTSGLDIMNVSGGVAGYTVTGTATLAGTSTGTVSIVNTLNEVLDRKEIIVYPFSLNPEGSNPAGAVNFSKVSHAKLTIDVDPIPNADCTIDVYAVYYNWLQIKDGRALTSFA
jgi:hypothetical protein